MILPLAWHENDVTHILISPHHPPVAEPGLRLPDDVRAVERHLLRSVGGRHPHEAQLRHDDVIFVPVLF